MGLSVKERANSLSTGSRQGVTSWDPLDQLRETLLSNRIYRTAKPCGTVGVDEEDGNVRLKAHIDKVRRCFFLCLNGIGH